MPKGHFKNSKLRSERLSNSLRRGSYFNCIECSKEFWRQPSAIKKGDCKFCSRQCYQTWQKGKSKLSGFKLNPLKGENNPKWKGGITTENHKIRNSIIYKEWRKKIFIRDNWTCQKCLARSKKNNYIRIEVHHIKPFALFPNLRFEINNGVTLCKNCHYREPKGKEIYAISDSSL